MARNLALIANRTIAGATTIVGDPVALPMGVKTVAVLSKLVVAGGGTTVKVYLQTSLDGGVTWIDVACHAFTTSTASKVSAVRASVALAAGVTPGDGALTDNTILDGLMGDRIRAKAVVAGTYTGASSLTVAAVAN